MINTAMNEFQLATLKYAPKFSKIAKKADTKSKERKNKILFDFAEKFLETPFKNFIAQKLIKNYDKLEREVRLTYVIGIYITINSTKLKNQAKNILQATIDEMNERINNENK